MKRRVISLILVLMLIIPSFSAFAEEETVDLDLINTILDYIDNYYKYDISREELIQGAYKGIADVLDTHSKYFTPEEYSDFLDSLEGSLIGIGIYIEAYENYVKVISPIEGTPAYNAGMKAGDIITHVDDNDVTKYTFEQAIDMIKGEEGTEVKITVRREQRTLEFNIIREVIEIDDVEYEMLDNKVGYVRIKQFGDEVAEEIDTAIMDLKSQGMTSIIVDLRNNPGGYLSEVIKVADWFVDIDDPIVHIDYEAFSDEDYYAKKESLNIPTAILINGGSASASEILAGAIQNNEEGTIIGTLSYGKGTVQNLIDLSNGAIKLTTAEYLTAGKVVINNVGVTPDIIIEAKNGEALKIVESFAPMNETNKVWFGNVGLNTYGAQQRLNFLGYDLEVDGIFGVNTAKAIEDFQIKRNIHVSYALDDVTKAELEIAILECFEEDPQLQRAIKTVTE